MATRIRQTPLLTYYGIYSRVTQRENDAPVVHQTEPGNVSYVAHYMEDFILPCLKETKENPEPCSWKDPFRFNPVENTSISITDIDFSSIRTSVVYDSSWKVSYKYAVNLANNFSRLVYLNDLPVPQQYSAFALKSAFEALQPTFKDAKVNGINVYTAILELADLKKTFTKSAWSLKRTFSDLPEKNLLINFGVLPLFNDIVAIYDIITKLSGYIDTWNQAASDGTVWDRHEDIPMEHDPLIVEVDEYAGSYTDLHLGTRKSRVVKVSREGKAHLYFKPRKISDQDRRRVFYNALGLAEPLEGIWEAVPFSWAIDYFFRVGDFIAAFDEALPSMFRYEFVSGGYSEKITGEGRYFYNQVAQRENRYWTALETEAPWSFTYKLDQYKRIPVSFHGMMDILASPDEYSNGWNKGYKQASYLASVAYLLGFKK